MALVGINFVLFLVLANTLLQILSPDHMRRRIMGHLFVATQTGMHVGALQESLVADWVCAPLSMGPAATLSLIYGLWVAIKYRRVRELQ